MGACTMKRLLAILVILALLALLLLPLLRAFTLVGAHPSQPMAPADLQLEDVSFEADPDLPPSFVAHSAWTDQDFQLTRLSTLVVGPLRVPLSPHA